MVKEIEQYFQFVMEHLPSSEIMTGSQQNKIFGLFELKKYNASAVLFKEGQNIYSGWHQDNEDKPDGKRNKRKESAMSNYGEQTPVKNKEVTDAQKYLFLIVSGLVRLESENNPYLRKQYNKLQLLPKTRCPHKLYDKGGGQVGNVCSTFNKSTLASVSNGIWIGEEFELTKGKVPVFYSAYCETDVVMIVINKTKFHEKMPPEIQRKMEDRAYAKLETFNNKLKTENEKRTRIESMDTGSKYLAKTMHHMQNIYPAATLQTQKKINAIFNKKAEGNPFKIVTLMEGRLESKINKLEPGAHQERSNYKTVMYKRQKEIFENYEEILESQKKPSDLYQKDIKTLYTFDYRDVVTNKQRKEERDEQVTSRLVSPERQKRNSKSPKRVDNKKTIDIDLNSQRLLSNSGLMSPKFSKAKTVALP